MNCNQLLDPSYAYFLDEPSSEWTLATLPEIRNRINSSFKAAGTGRCEHRWTSDSPDTTGIRLCLYRPDQADEGVLLPCIMYIHGGGFVLGRPEMVDDYLAELANELNSVIVAVDYRLAPEHPFPIPLEDCYTALSWTFTNSLSVGIDTEHVVLMGHSAGGGLAASLALLARERNQYRISGLMMIYPMLDHRTGSLATTADNPTTGKLSWSREANQFCWECLQGSYSPSDEKAFYFSPALAVRLQGLPPSFICVGALDLFLEEDVNFALNLSRSGVATEMHVYPGVPHMFDLGPGDVTDRCRRDIAAALRRMLAR
ncbi:lipase [Pseudomonas syringae CC1557]|uniref:Lipase n=1 Tax=Pseudomonas syringae CC1557 TaxID=1357279 RepID=W0MML9_PSESX|nr:alpha/beta hydrolase [Pseudomonas syringae]AHG39687.1 lipase [Pseudomonas syringae CC1557]